MWTRVLEAALWPRLLRILAGPCLRERGCSVGV